LATVINMARRELVNTPEKINAIAGHGKLNAK
jgi:hypothetical protein